MSEWTNNSLETYEKKGGGRRRRKVWRERGEVDYTIGCSYRHKNILFRWERQAKAICIRGSERERRRRGRKRGGKEVTKEGGEDKE